MEMSFDDIKSIVGDQQCRLVLQQKEIALLKDQLSNVTQRYNTAAEEINKLTAKKPRNK